MGNAVIKSRFASKCRRCGRQISVGAQIVNVGGTWVCGSCGSQPAPRPKPVSFTPTTEQRRALDMFTTGNDLAIQAGAGAGKTSTLVLMSNATLSRGQFVAFNKAIVEDARAKLPDHVKANTAHSLAYGRVGHKYRERMDDSKRMRSDQVAKILRLKPLSAGLRVLDPEMCAQVVIEALRLFCQSADPAPSVRHFPYLEGIDAPKDDGARGWVNNAYVRTQLLPAVEWAWKDVQLTKGGKLPFDYAYYLKMAQLQGIKIGADFILFDECQDASPVLLDIVEHQDAQRVFVGDPNQAIYEWTGAVDAFGRLEDHVLRTTLSQSFRFGQGIADIANRVLVHLDGFVVQGMPSKVSTITEIPHPKCILARTNGMAVAELLGESRAGRKAHLVGGGAEVIAFLDGAEKLKAGQKADHRDLGCFANWSEVQDYVDNDFQGQDLKTMVNLIDRFGVPAIRACLKTAPPEHKADVVVSTAHKSKGREWDSVRLASDFSKELDDMTAEDLRLLYVAVTRAKAGLDITEVDCPGVLTARKRPMAA